MLRFAKTRTSYRQTRTSFRISTGKKGLNELFISDTGRGGLQRSCI